MAYAGKNFDPTWWKIVLLHQKPAGVILPQVFAAEQKEGSIFYIGILPAFRGQGLGKILHACGLAFLAQKKIMNYIGSTDVRNTAMISVFKKNGCTQTGIQLYYRG